MAGKPNSDRRIRRAREIQGAIREALQAVPRYAEGEPQLAVAELDRALTDEHPAIPLDSLGELRSLAADAARPTGTATEAVGGIEPAVRLDLGTTLVPSDAAENWQQWILFTTTIPRLRSELQALLGFPAPAVRVRESEELSPGGYVVCAFGEPASTGFVDAPEPASQSSGAASGSARPKVSELHTDELWSAPMSSIRRIILDEPSRFFLPESLDDLLNEWSRQLNADPEGSDDRDASRTAHRQLLDSIQDNATARVRLWRELRRELDRASRVPEGSELHHYLQRAADSDPMSPITTAVNQP